MIKFVQFANNISPHQLPLAKEIIALVGEENFRYVYCEELSSERKALGWKINIEPWMLSENDPVAKMWLENADILLVGGIRPLELMERRSAKGLKTFYQSERWFKPFYLLLLWLPGWLRLFSLTYLKMVWRFVRWVNRDEHARILSIGPLARRDFILMGINKNRIIDWGYFVEPSKVKILNDDFLLNDVPFSNSTRDHLKVIYVGRLLKLKHVDTIIRGVIYANTLYSKSIKFKIVLTILGSGTEEKKLKKLTVKLSKKYQIDEKLISFCPPVSISDVRVIMRKHDVLILASNGFEGWGAVVSEALEENLSVVGTYEAGASSTLLPDECLFHCGDWKKLGMILSKPIPKTSIGEWSAKNGARKLLKI